MGEGNKGMGSRQPLTPINTALRERSMLGLAEHTEGRGLNMVCWEVFGPWGWVSVPFPRNGSLRLPLCDSNFSAQCVAPFAVFCIHHFLATSILS